MIAKPVPPMAYTCLTKKPTRTTRAIIKNNIAAALKAVANVRYEQPVSVEGPITKN